jgi:hypothetical protein
LLAERATEIWVERNLQIDYRWPAADAASVREGAAELVALAPNVILASDICLWPPFNKLPVLRRSFS